MPRRTHPPGQERVVAARVTTAVAKSFVTRGDTSGGDGGDGGTTPAELQAFGSEYSFLGSGSRVVVDQYSGEGSITYTTPVTGYLPDYEDNAVAVTQNTSPIYSARVTENFIPSASAEDLTHANWTAVGGTPAATTFLATADNATLIHAAVTMTDKTVVARANIYRLVGSGAVYLTLNGGEQWVRIYPTGVTTSVYFVYGETITDPQFGIKLANDTDQVFVSYVQAEDTTDRVTEAKTLSSEYNDTGGQIFYVDDNGNSVVYANPTPVVDAGGPYSGVVSTAIPIAATVDPGTDPMLWTIVSGGAGTFADDTAASTTFTPSSAATYSLKLTVTPSVGPAVSDTAALTSSGSYILNMDRTSLSHADASTVWYPTQSGDYIEGTFTLTGAVTGNAPCVLSQETNNGLRFRVASFGRMECYFVDTAGAERQVNGLNPIVTDTEYSFRITFNATDVVLNMNGTDYTSTSDPKLDGTANGLFRIGAASSVTTTSAWNGVIKDVTCVSGGVTQRQFSINDGPGSTVFADTGTPGGYDLTQYNVVSGDWEAV